MKRSAHGLVPNHPIFHTPFPVDLSYEDVPTPDNYRKYLSGADLPAELPVWHVDTTDYKSDPTLRPGTISTGYGFEDSPDAEVIAFGLNNSKGPNGVALGRHGSFFLWGFACEPARMTESGQKAFLNSICYIQEFDHSPLLVRRTGRDRQWALERAAKDPEELAQVRRDLEFLREAEKGHAVDEDCRALGISNRDVALLEHCVAALERSEDLERSERLLRRYTGLDHATAAEWRGWLTEAGPRLFFSDRGGFRFYEAEKPAGAPAPAADDAGDDPVTITASVLPAEAGPGEVVTLAVRLDHDFGWHTYVSVPPGSPYHPTRLSVELPEGWQTVGRWTEPASELLHGEDGVRIATGGVLYLQRIRIGADTAAGEVELGARVSYLACDEERCLPPADAEVSATVRCRGPKTPDEAKRR